MFLVIPISFIVGSVVVIFVIIKKKMSHLGELNYSSYISGESDSAKNNLGWGSVFLDSFPEVKDGLQKLGLKEHVVVWLLELEKFLRKLRLFFLKVDRLSEALIKKIRGVHLRSMVDKAPMSVSGDISKEGTTSSMVSVKKKEEPSQSSIFKKEEQNLILEIAHNPKNPLLYENLGDLYMRMNNFEDARDSFKAAMELSPNSEELLKKHSQAVEKMVK